MATLDLLEHEGSLVVVSELVEGKSLRQLLDSQRVLSPELTIHVGTRVADALDHAHSRGLVHRNVKPGSILVTQEGDVLLSNFGVAKAIGGDGRSDHTSPGVVLGTAKYVAPEQVRGRRVDGRADLYGLAITLYECLAGRVPFVGESEVDTALARLQRDPTSLDSLNLRVPIELTSIVHRALSLRPVDRPRTGREMSALLESLLSSPETARDRRTRFGTYRTQTIAAPLVLLDRRVEALIREVRLALVENDELQQWIDHLTLQGRRLNTENVELQNKISSLQHYVRELESYADALDAQRSQAGYDEVRLMNLVECLRETSSWFAQYSANVAAAATVALSGVVGASLIDTTVEPTPPPITVIHASINTSCDRVLDAADEVLSSPPEQP